MSKWICLPSEKVKGSTLKGKNFLPVGEIFFLLEQTPLPLQKGIGVQESKQKVTKVVSHVKKGLKNVPSVSSPLKIKHSVPVFYAPRRISGGAYSRRFVRASVRPCVRASVRPCVRPALVHASSRKLLVGFQ